jgi:hypothetical protein
MHEGLLELKEQGWSTGVLSYVVPVKDWLEAARLLLYVVVLSSTWFDQATSC